ncbi:hypothetical protein J6590_073953 [Homalodisca vitripennis]|nr:hypothetical protein J6590_073953 [Homalodisca vitripennis]
MSSDGDDNPPRAKRSRHSLVLRTPTTSQTTDDDDDSSEESSSENEDNFLSGSRTSGLAITELSSSVGRDSSGHLDGSRGRDGSRVPSSRSQRDRDICDGRGECIWSTEDTPSESPETVYFSDYMGMQRLQRT